MHIADTNANPDFFLGMLQTTNKIIYVEKSLLIWNGGNSNVLRIRICGFSRCGVHDAKEKNVKKYLPVFAVPALNALSIAVSPITNETRYLLLSVTLFPTLFMLLLVKKEGGQ